MTVGNTGRGPGAERSDMGDLRGIDRARAERLLAGTDPGTDPIGRLLAAARAPGTPAELRGEAAALGAFRIGATREPRGRVTARRRLWPRPAWPGPPRSACCPTHWSIPAPGSAPARRFRR